jgi:hypothetical protein
MQQLRVLKVWGLLCVDGVSALVQSLSALSQLEHLAIYLSSHETDDEIQPLDDLAAYSALLPPSTRLTYLEFAFCYDCMMPLLPYGSLRHVFAAGRQLLMVQQLVLGVPDEVWEWSEDGLTDFGGHVGQLEYLFGPGDVGRLVACFPALQRLAFAGLVEPGVEMSPLLQLTALTELSVGGEVVDDDDVASSVLAQLTGLQRLDLHCTGVSDKGLLQLIALTALTRLSASFCRFSSRVSSRVAARRSSSKEEGCLEVERKVSRCVLQ